MILLANEFLDALPIRQFVRRGAAGQSVRCQSNGLYRRAFDPALETIDGLPAEIEASRRQAMSSSAATAEAIWPLRAARFTGHPGAALFLDYGPEMSAMGDSLQAITSGQPVDPLGPAGAADLTAHVDFARFGAAAKGAQVHGPIPQGLFLARLGLFQRTNLLARGLPGASTEAAAMMEGARRLAEPDRMGRLFKAIALVSPGIATPPGFEAG